MTEQKRFYTDPEYQKEQLSINPSLICLIVDQTEQMQLDAVKLDGSVIALCNKPTNQVYMEAIRNKPEVIKMIPRNECFIDLAMSLKPEVVEGLKLSAAQQRKLIEMVNEEGRAGTYFKYISNPHYTIIPQAVRLYPENIKYLKNTELPESVQLAVVTEDSTLIEYIFNPTESVQMTAVVDNIENYELILSPYTSVSLYVLQKKKDYFPLMANKSECINVTGVEADPTNIQYVNHPKDEIVMIALDADIDNYKLVNSPLSSLIKQRIKNELLYTVE